MHQGRERRLITVDNETVEIEVEALDSAADTFTHGATDLQPVIDRVRSLQSIGTEIIGEYGTVDALHRFIEAWTNELTLYATAVGEIAGKFRATAQLYRDADEVQ